MGIQWHSCAWLSDVVSAARRFLAEVLEALLTDEASKRWGNYSTSCPVAADVRSRSHFSTCPFLKRKFEPRYLGCYSANSRSLVFIRGSPIRCLIPKSYFHPHDSRAIHSAHERTAIKSEGDEDALRGDTREHRRRGTAPAGVRGRAELQAARHQFAGEFPKRAR